MGKIGPWRILRFFSAKVDFWPFYVLFWAFFGLLKHRYNKSSFSTAMCLTYLESSIPLVSYEKVQCYGKLLNKHILKLIFWTKKICKKNYVRLLTTKVDCWGKVLRVCFEHLRTFEFRAGFFRLLWSVPS
jgi:hypothetical protein